MASGGQRIQTERQQYMSEWQQVVPCAEQFFRHTPNNVFSKELLGDAQEFMGWHATAAYVFPFDTPTTRMDSESAERFLDLLRAKDRDALMMASARLGLIRSEEAPVLPGELSIARMRNVLTGFCACFKLRRTYKGFRWLGTCRIFCRMGSCPHELCARFLGGDADVSMACLSQWTHAEEPASIEAADVQLRAEKQHVPPLPPAAALCTLTFLMQRAKQRSEKRAAAGTKRRRSVASLLESPSRKMRSEVTTDASEVARRKLLDKLAQHLASQSYTVYFPTLQKCLADSVTLKEAKKSGVERHVRQLLVRDKSLPVKLAVHRVLKAWGAM
jgi:hypothetical protein